MGDGQQPPFDQDDPERESFWVIDVEVGRRVGGCEGERGVLVRGQGRVGVESHPSVPSQDADGEVEEGTRVAAGEHDGESGNDRGDRGSEPKGSEP